MTRIDNGGHGVKNDPAPLGLHPLHTQFERPLSKMVAFSVNSCRLSWPLAPPLCTQLERPLSMIVVFGSSPYTFRPLSWMVAFNSDPYRGMGALSEHSERLLTWIVVSFRAIPIEDRSYLELVLSENAGMSGS
jgi:hypothetical protein